MKAIWPSLPCHSESHKDRITAQMGEGREEKEKTRKEKKDGRKNRGKRQSKVRDSLLRERI